MIAATAVLNQIPLDWQGNHERIVRAIRLAKESGANLLLLPELAISGFGAGNHFRRKEVREKAETMLAKLLEETQGIAVLLGLPVELRGKAYNALAWVENGAIEFVHAKTRLMQRYTPEHGWFSAWNPGSIEFLKIAGQPVPFGDFTNFEQKLTTGEKPLRFRIHFGEGRFESYDSEMPFDILLHPCASPFAFGKQVLRREYARSFTRANRCVYLYANHLGCESGRFVYDGGALIASSGTILAQSPRFSFEELQVVACELPSHKTQIKSTELASDHESVTVSKEEEFAKILPLALFDYMRKTRSRGFVLSLSGGADSGAIAVLTAMMVRFAWRELGRERFLETLAYFPELRQCDTPEKALHELLCCVYQSTRNSGETTRHAAETLAGALGANFFELDIDPMLEAYKNGIARHFSREISWDTDDQALQNIQARARVPGIWFLANLRGSLLLSTGNRSEATLGYTTMDGDTCGSLAPISGVDKAFLRRWLLWMEQAGCEGFTVPALKEINVQQPTAELRPQGSNQTDEADLMPYPVLDRLEKLIVRDHLSCDPAAEICASEFPQHSPEEHLLWAQRFFTLWTRNQWKRERYALGFHLDDETLPPNEWGQYPFFIG